MIWPLTVLPRFDGHPAPTDLRFDGLTILLTAASGGIGLAAAKSLVERGTSTLIVTARTEQKAVATAELIQTHLSGLHSKSHPTIVALPLEMNDTSSILSFVKALKSHVQHLDHAILSAGMLFKERRECPDTGYEESVQVNAISPIFLALQLIPLLLNSPLVKQADVELRPHLTIVSSGTAWSSNLEATPAISADTATPLADLSQPSNFPSGTIGGQTQYGRSKLMLQHAIRPLAHLECFNDKSSSAATPDPLVLVSSVCPGPVATDLARNHTTGSIFFTVVVWFIYFLVRPPEVGANIYISSLGNGNEARGEQWRDDIIVSGHKARNTKSEAGAKMGNAVWKEMQPILKKMDEAGQGLVARYLGV